MLYVLAFFECFLNVWHIDRLNAVEFKFAKLIQCSGKLLNIFVSDRISVIQLVLSLLELYVADPRFKSVRNTILYWSQIFQIDNPFLVIRPRR